MAIAHQPAIETMIYEEAQAALEGLAAVEQEKVVWAIMQAVKPGVPSFGAMQQIEQQAPKSGRWSKAPLRRGILAAARRL
jgi:hypothetical protein